MEKRVKVYKVVCSYIVEDGSIVKISVDSMLNRLDLPMRSHWWGTEYEIPSIVIWNFDNNYHVKYEVVEDWVFEHEINIEKYPFSFLPTRESAEPTADYMNLCHDQLFMSLNEEESEYIRSHYGHDYTNQIKGRRD